MDWARILAYVTGTVDQELLARNEYLAAKNRIMKSQLKGRPNSRTPRRKLRSSACSATTSFRARASRRRSVTSLLVAARAVSPARRRLPASRNSFDQLQ
jgi:hypothetical protein